MIKNLIHLIFKLFKKKLININSFERRLFLDKLIIKKSGHRLIRIGPNEDGGYILPDDLQGISACFSPGTGDKIEFEKDLLLNHNIISFMCDGTIKKLINLPKGLYFTNKNLSVNQKSNSITLKNWIDTYKIKGDFILQMDIEGSEYSILLDLERDYLTRFRIVLIEFHNLDLILNDQFFLVVKDVFHKILNDFTIVHVNPNNCCGVFSYKNLKIPKVMEFSFLRNDRIINKEIDNSENISFQNVKNKKKINFNNFH